MVAVVGSVGGAGRGRHADLYEHAPRGNRGRYGERLRKVDGEIAGGGDSHDGRRAARDDGDARRVTRASADGCGWRRVERFWGRRGARSRGTVGQPSRRYGWPRQARRSYGKVEFRDQYEVDPSGYDSESLPSRYGGASRASLLVAAHGIFVRDDDQGCAVGSWRS